MNDASFLEKPLCQLPVAAIDFESAGVQSGDNDAPVQVGVLRASELFGELEHFCTYIACHRPIHWSAARIHGISTEMLRGAPSMSDLWLPLRDLLSDCLVVGHNPSTERRFLNVFPGHGFSPWLDTLALIRHALPNQPDYSLEAVCQLLGLTAEVQKLVPNKSWHDAHFDAAASLILFRFLVTELNMQNACLADIPFAVKGS